MKVGKARQTARRSIGTTTKTVRSCLQELAIDSTDRDRTTAPGANSNQVSQPGSTADADADVDADADADGSPGHFPAPLFKGPRGPPGGPSKDQMMLPSWLSLVPVSTSFPFVAM